MTDKPISGSSLGLLAAFAAFGIFSAHDALIKLLGAQYSVFQILFFSGLFAFVPVTLMMSTDRALDNFIPKKPWLVAGRSLTNVIAMSSAFYAFSVLPLAEVYALIFATPLLITILAVPLLGESIRLRRSLAVLVGLIGVVIVIRPGASELTAGHGAALLAAFASALSAIAVRKLGRTERTAVILLYPMLALLVVTAALLPWVYEPFELADLVLMAAVGLFAFVAQMLIVAAYRMSQATVVAPIQYSQMIWAVVYGALFFNEFPDKWVVAGSVIIIASGVYIVLREGRGDVSQTNPVLNSPNMRADTGPGPKPKILREILQSDD